MKKTITLFKTSIRNVSSLRAFNFKRRLSVLRLFAFLVTFLGLTAQVSMAQTYTKITSLADLTDGDYVIVGNGSTTAMNSTLSNGKFGGTAVTITSNTITNPAAAIVYTITTSSGNIKTIKNANGYVNYNSSTNFAVVSTATNNTAKWTASYNTTYFRFANVGTSTRIVGYNGSAFGAYASSNATNSGAASTSNIYDVQLYKKSTAATPSITAPSPASLSGFSTTAGMASVAQNFIVGGSNLTADLVVTAPIDYEVRENGIGSFGSSVSFTPSSGTVATKTIEVRIAASAAAGSPSGNVTCTSTGATSQNIAVSGTVNSASSPLITIDGALNAFANTVINATSTEQSYTVLGANLTDNIIITPPAGFEISKTTGSSFVASPSTLTFTPAEVLTAQNVYVRFAPTAAQAYSGNITHTSTGATQVDKAVSGTGVNAEPTNQPTNFTATTNSTSQITVTWTDATGVQAPASYLIIASTGTPTAPTDGIAQADAALVKNITQGTQQAVFTGLSTSTTYNFSIWPYTNSGAAIDYKTDGAPTANATTATPLGTPVATAATDISATGFTANWGAAASATGYDVNVYTKTAGAVASDLFVSEYIDGASGTNKAIEIYNGTGSAIDLSNYKLWIISNGGSWPETTINLTGILQNNGVFVITNGTDFSNLTNNSNLTSTALSFNGDDAVGLAKNISSTWTLIDVIGVDGTDPGTGWNVSGITNATADRVLIRKSSVVSPNTNWDNSRGTSSEDSEWIVGSGGGNADASGFGSHTMNGGSSSTPISGSPFTVSGSTNKVVSGLNSSTAYYYTVVAKDAETSSEASNEITVFTAIDGTVDASTLPDCATCDLVVNDGGEVTLNASKSYHSVSVKPRAKLTLNNGHAFAPGTFVLESDATGTATFVDKRTNGNKTAITATVKQYLPAATERLWWYLASPVSDDASTVFGSNKVGEYSETTRSYSSPFGEATTLVAGKGYVVKMTAVSASNYVFSNKTINTGDISIGVTLTVTETADNSKRGFNLVGNPYPSYLNWDMAYNASTNVRPSIWYRTLDNGSMTFHTYNATLGASVPSTASGYIPPMQAFWVKVDTDPVSPATVSNGTINLTNDMRSHNESGTGNPLKAPAVERPLIRLAISNGSTSDETVIVAHASALDSYDSFDSEKMSNESTNVAEIYSLAGNHELVINGISPMVPGQEIMLGLRPGRIGDFSISSTQFDNIPTDVKVILKDKLTGAETELSKNASYNFSSDAAETNQRFSLLFRAPGSVTGTDLINKSTLLVYTQQSAIVINSADLKGSNITVYTATGQSVLKTVATANREVLNGNFTTGVYFVKVNNAVRKVNVR